MGAVHIVLKSREGKFPDIYPTGASISYRIADIPTAVLSLAPGAIPAFCNFDSLRRSMVEIQISTVNGCLVFDGYLDGLSSQMNVGGVSISLVVKSGWQLMREIDPKLPGYSPSSVDMFRWAEVIKFSGDPDNVLTQETLNALNQTAADGPAIDGILNVLKTILIRKADYAQYVSNPNYNSALVLIYEVLKSTHLTIGKTLLDNVVTSYLSGMRVGLTTPFALNQIMQVVSMNHLSIFDLLLNLLALFECTLVIGNRKSYVIPNVGFLKINHPAGVNRGEVSSYPNILFPAQYEAYSFNDNGYKDIRACALVSDSVLPPTTGDNLNTPTIGYYIDPNAKGGVIVETLPLFINMAGYISNYNSQYKAQTATSSGDNFSKSASKAAPSTNITRQETETRTTPVVASAANSLLNDEMYYANEWAKLKYLQAKYIDRTGTVSMAFNPRFAPGAVGTMYTRQPGTWLDFFVQAVTHEIRIDAPSVGTATTSIAFNCGRMGNSSDAAIDKIDFFEFDATSSLNYASEFVQDVTGK